MHDTIAKQIPQLARGQVWCRSCGRTQRTDSAEALRSGWPKCCGYTMTIDASGRSVDLLTEFYGMTKDELIEMAKDAGFRVFGGKIVAADNGISGDASQSIERFAALVAAKEREECAKVCDDIVEGDNGYGCASVIRARNP